MAFITLRAMVRKDLQLFFSDRRSVIMGFAAPILIASFFGSIFGGSGNSGEPARIPIMIADQDGGVISHSIITAIQDDKTLGVTLASPDSARAAVRRGKVTVSVLIPKGFGDAAGKAFFDGRNKPELDLLYDPSHTAELGMVRGMLMGDVIQAVSKEMFGGARGGVLAEQSLQQLDSLNIPADQKQRYRDILLATRDLRQGNAQDSAPVSAPGMTMPYAVKEEAATANENATYNGYAHAFAGMGVQFLLFAAIDLGVGILLERQRGLWKRLRSAPLSKGMLLGGKALSGTIITLMTLLVSFTFAIVVFKVRIHGSVIGFLSVATATALMASTFGLLIASLGRTPNATRGVAILATLLMVMLGGAWVPSFIFPQWLQQATVVVPARWAVDGLDAMTWRGIGLSGAVLPTAVLLGFAVLFGSVAVLRFRWEES
jgi:ABC-2 type transport system permease protein